MDLTKSTKCGEENGVSTLQAHLKWELIKTLQGPTRFGVLLNPPSVVFQSNPPKGGVAEPLSSPKREFTKHYKTQQKLESS